MASMFQATDETGLVFGDQAPKDVGEMLKYKDEGHIELILKVLANMCDGQNKVLQVNRNRNIFVFYPQQISWK